MIQVRCPECGYLQTLSDERFLAVSDDYLHCPHCNAKVPKEWHPVDGDSIPDEAAHKMLAFSRRILNGGDVSREVVYALESLVRHYGATGDAVKALGIGYAHIGEWKKAEEFLRQALHDSPHDADTLRCMLRTSYEGGEFTTAIRAGEDLIAVSKERDEDVALLALAFTDAGRTEEANRLLDSYPNIDNRNALMKQARKRLGRGGGLGVASLLRKSGLLKRLTERRSERREAEDSRKAQPHDRPQPTAGTGARDAEPEADPGARYSDGLPAPAANRSVLLLEYWVYSPIDRIPTWEEMRDRLAALIPDRAEREKSFRLLELLIDEERMTIDHILRSDAVELFEYPRDLIPFNSRELSESDLKTLTESRMIVRLRLSTPGNGRRDHLTFMIRFVEVIRSLTGGVVQDAVSHTLWGADAWGTRVVARPTANLTDSHLQFEILDEGDTVWIHSHGMQKFGLPDLEIEDVPRESARVGLRLMHLISETILKLRAESKLDFDRPAAIDETTLQFLMQYNPRDPEGHFPGGSLTIRPFVRDYDPESPATLRHTLKLLEGRYQAVAVSEPPKAEDETAGEGDAPTFDPEKEELRRRLTEAHRQARAALPQFKQSFRDHSPEDAVHAVKICFPAEEGGMEWMWISLDAWRGDSLVGHLENTPVVRTDMRKGARIQVSEHEIYDWAISRPGGEIEGAFTESLRV